MHWFFSLTALSHCKTRVIEVDIVIAIAIAIAIVFCCVDFSHCIFSGSCCRFCACLWLRGSCCYCCWCCLLLRQSPGHNTLGIMMMSSLARTSAPPGWDCILLVYFGVSMFASRTLLSIGGAKCENVFLRCTFDCCLNWSGTKSDKADDKKYCNPLKRPSTLWIKLLTGHILYSSRGAISGHCRLEPKATKEYHSLSLWLIFIWKNWKLTRIN